MGNKIKTKRIKPLAFIKHRAPMPLLTRALVMFAASTALWLIIYSTINALFGSEYSRETHIVRAVSVFVLSMAMVLVLRRIMDGQANLKGLGLYPLSRAWRPFLVGAAAWLVPAGAALIVAVLAGWTEITATVPISTVAWSTLSLIFLVFIYEAFPEEVIFRGYIFQNAALARHIWFAVGFQAVLFVAWGALNGGEVTIDRALLFLVFGIVVGMMRAISGSVWTAIGYHVAFQTVAQYFGSVGGGEIALSNQGLSLIIFGVVPIAFAIPVLRRFYRTRPDWRSKGTPLP